MVFQVKMFEKKKKKKKTNKRFKSKVQSPNFWSTFAKISSIFPLLFYHLFWGVALVFWSVTFCSFHPTFAVCIAVSQFSSYFCSFRSGFPVFIPLCSLHRSFPVYSTFASQLTRSLHPSYHPSLQMHYIAVESQS